MVHSYLRKLAPPPIALHLSITSTALANEQNMNGNIVHFPSPLSLGPDLNVYNRKKNIRDFNPEGGTLDTLIHDIGLCLKPEYPEQGFTGNDKTSLRTDLDNAKGMKATLDKMNGILDETDVDKKGSDAAKRYEEERVNYTKYYNALKKYGLTQGN